jgi:hypothetical protein
MPLYIFYGSIHAINCMLFRVFVCTYICVYEWSLFFLKPPLQLSIYVNSCQMESDCQLANLSNLIDLISRILVFVFKFFGVHWQVHM